MKLINLVIILTVLLIVSTSAATIKEIEKCADKLYEYGKIDEAIEVKVKDEDYRDGFMICEKESQKYPKLFEVMYGDSGWFGN